MDIDLVLLATDTWFQHTGSPETLKRSEEGKLEPWEQFVCLFEEPGITLDSTGVTLRQIFDTIVKEWDEMASSWNKDHDDEFGAPISFNEFIEKIVKPGYVEVAIWIHIEDEEETRLQHLISNGKKMH